MWHQLRDVLTDLEFLQARLGCPNGLSEELAATDIFDILEDYVAAMEGAPEEAAWREVAELYRVLDGNSHVLKLDTSMVLQQVFNALAGPFGNATPLGQRLRRAAADYRRWWLNGPATRRDWLRVLTGHEEVVSCVAFSPDRRTLASGSKDATIRLWDVRTGKQLHVLTGHTRSVQSVSFAPGGKLLASGGEDQTVRLWDLAERRERCVLTGHTDVVQSVSFAPGGELLASGGEDQTVRLWEVASCRQLAWLPDVLNTTGLWFSADGRELRVAGAGADSGRPDIRILRIVNGKLKPSST